MSTDPTTCQQDGAEPHVCDTDPTTAAPATPGQLDLPPGIELDLVRWHCTRCETRGTWIRDARIDPVAEATAEAFGHHANHVQWDAERAARRGPLSTTPPAETDPGSAIAVDPPAGTVTL